MEIQLKLGEVWCEITNCVSLAQRSETGFGNPIKERNQFYKILSKLVEN